MADVRLMFPERSLPIGVGAVCAFEQGKQGGDSNRRCSTHRHDLEGIPTGELRFLASRVGAEHPPTCVLPRYEFVHAVQNERDIVMSLQKLFVLSVLTCSLSSLGVTSAADLSVNGHIRQDGACSIALGNGGIIDLGYLSTSAVKSIEDPVMSLTIDCQKPTTVGFTLIDNRAGTKPPNAYGFGLGNPAIGTYSFGDSGYSSAVGQSVHRISRRKGETTWVHSDYWGAHTGGMTSWALDNAPPVPVAFKTLTDRLWIVLSIRPNLAVTDEMEIDGSATLELAYL